MSGGTIITLYDEKRACWRLLWGGETFYDDQNILMTWATEQDALDWAKEHHGDLQRIKSSDQKGAQKRFDL